MNNTVEKIFYKMRFSFTQSCGVRAVFHAVRAGFPVAQMVEHGASNAKIMGSIPRESKSW